MFRFIFERNVLHCTLRIVVMAEDTGCMNYLLSCSNTWEAHETLSLISSYSPTLLCGRNMIKIEPLFESNYEEDLCRGLNTQKEENNFKCDICSKLFNTSGQLIMHNRKHTVKKLYKRKICEKFFITISALTSHGRTHTGEKPYICKICNKQFSERGSLSRHTRVHTGEKPFKCKVCNKDFTQRISLKGHIITHTGEKPFKCKICEKSFTTSSILTIHWRTHW